MSGVIWAQAVCKSIWHFITTSRKKVYSLSACVCCWWPLETILTQIRIRTIWAVTCDFQQCGILTSVDFDKHLQPPFKLRNSKWRSVSSLTTGGHQRNYREIASTWICSFVTSWTFCVSGIVTQKPNKGRYSRLFWFLVKEWANYVKIQQCYSM